MKMDGMTSPSLPPQRPKARAMLDASAQQKVTDGRTEAAVGRDPSQNWMPKASARGSKRSGGDTGGAPTTAASEGARRAPFQVGGAKQKGEAKTKSRRFGSRKGTAEAAGKTAKSTGKSSSDRRPSAIPRTSTSPGSSAKARRKKIPVRSHKARAKWSFGGLTVSIRSLVAIAVTVVLLTTLVPLGLQWMKQEQAYRAILAEVAQTQADNDAMRDELADWENEDFVAAKARERLGFVRPGETQYVVTDAPDPQSGAERSPVPVHKGPAKPWMWHVAETLKDADEPQPSPVTSEDVTGDSGSEANSG